MVSIRLVNKSNFLPKTERKYLIFYQFVSKFFSNTFIALYLSTFTKAISVSVKPSFGLIVLRYVPPEEVGGVGGARAIIKGPKP
jgi:hypothetical protein